MKGIVYILSNPAMPGIVKIGRTTRGDMKQRLKELFTTGVPVPFDCVFACDVDNCVEVEKALHIAFRPYQIHPSREFFKIEPDQPMAILKLFDKKDVTAEVTQAIDSQITDLDREAGEKLKRQRRPPLNFKEMGIPVGTTLTFNTGDKSALVTVCADKKVLYNGQDYSLTQLTRELLELDYNVQPTRYWSYNGKSLAAIYEEVYWEEGGG